MLEERIDEIYDEMPMASFLGLAVLLLASTILYFFAFVKLVIGDVLDVLSNLTFYVTLYTITMMVLVFGLKNAADLISLKLVGMKFRQQEEEIQNSLVRRINCAALPIFLMISEAIVFGFDQSPLVGFGESGTIALIVLLTTFYSVWMFGVLNHLQHKGYEKEMSKSKTYKYVGDQVKRTEPKEKILDVYMYSAGEFASELDELLKNIRFTKKIENKIHNEQIIEINKKLHDIHSILEIYAKIRKENRTEIQSGIKETITALNNHLENHLLAEDRKNIQMIERKLNRIK